MYRHLTYNYTDWNIMFLAIYNAGHEATFVLVSEEDQVSVRIFGAATTARRVKQDLETKDDILTLE